MSEQRTPREILSREKTVRARTWAPAALLPDPTPEEGYTYRWIRISTLGNADPSNVSSKLREGWEPVKASAHPEVQLMSGEDGRFKDNIVMGGLMLCKTPTELVNQRNEHYGNQTQRQMESVDNNFMRDADPRMPVFRERDSRVSFGKGN
jgi:hypothetical protein